LFFSLFLWWLLSIVLFHYSLSNLLWCIYEWFWLQIINNSITRSVIIQASFNPHRSEGQPAIGWYYQSHSLWISLFVRWTCLNRELVEMCTRIWHSYFAYGCGHHVKTHVQWCDAANKSQTECPHDIQDLEYVVKEGLCPNCALPAKKWQSLRTIGLFWGI
jgi:hypothetical protein